MLMSNDITNRGGKRVADAKTKKRGPGKPPFEPTETQRYSVGLMAAIGIPQTAISEALEISEPTLRKYFKQELQTGRTRTITKVADSLVRQALAGNITAAIFYLKTQAGWKETQVHEHKHYDYENMDDDELAEIAGQDIDGKSS